MGSPRWLALGLASFAERFRGVPGHPYEQGFDLRLVPEKLAEPLEVAGGLLDSDDEPSPAGPDQVRIRQTDQCR